MVSSSSAAPLPSSTISYRSLLDPIVSVRIRILDAPPHSPPSLVPPSLVPPSTARPLPLGNSCELLLHLSVFPFCVACQRGLGSGNGRDGAKTEQQTGQQAGGSSCGGGGRRRPSFTDAAIRPRNWVTLDVISSDSLLRSPATSRQAQAEDPPPSFPRSPTSFPTCIMVIPLLLLVVIIIYL